MDLFFAEIGHLSPAVEGVLKETSAWVQGRVARIPCNSSTCTHGRRSAGRMIARVSPAISLASIGVWNGKASAMVALSRFHYRWGNVKRLLPYVENVA